MKRVALLVQYDGSHYSGWQKQKNATTVQEILERALLKITNHTVKTFAAGRTDAGVHHQAKWYTLMSIVLFQEIVILMS